METPYLVQIGKLKNTQKDGPSVDDLVNFEYMGSAEFEFGALPKSLKRICKNLDKYVISKLSTKNLMDVHFCLIHNPENVSLKEIQEFVDNQISNNPICLKERTSIKESVTGFGGWDNRKLEARQMYDIWWDIDNDFWIVLGNENASKILSSFYVAREKKKAAGEKDWF
ncbi:MAG: hypothetical protein WC055_00095 [Melioribacteraceae bacterium]